MIQTKSITTRPVLPQDDDFIYKVYAGTGRDELAPIPWTEAEKDAFVQMNPSALGVVGGSQPHNNLQPYLVVNFVIAMQVIYPPHS